MTWAKVRSLTLGPTVHPRSASRGRTSPMARVMVERSTPNQQASTSRAVACRSCTRGGQEPVDEDQPVLRHRAHSTLPRPGRKPGLVPFMPQRADLTPEFSDHVGRQVRDPPVTDDRCTRRVPHHTTMIGDQELDASPSCQAR